MNKKRGGKGMLAHHMALVAERFYANLILFFSKCNSIRDSISLSLTILVNQLTPSSEFDALSHNAHRIISSAFQYNKDIYIGHLRKQTI